MQTICRDNRKPSLQAILQMTHQLRAYQLNFLSFNASKPFCNAGQPTYQFDISQTDPPDFLHHVELASTKVSRGCLHLVTEMLGLVGRRVGMHRGKV
jgi:hypothetical protein